MSTTQTLDVIVPDDFSEYTSLETEEKSRLVQSGVLVRNSDMDNKLAGGGGKFTMPKWNDLDNAPSNISRDDEDERYETPAYTSGNNSKPLKTSAIVEEAVRLSRNQSWSAADLASELAGDDALAAIERRVINYMLRDEQRNFIATWKGVFADNDAAPTGTEHVLGDLSYNATGRPVGQRMFSAQNVLRAVLTLGDSMEDVGIIFMHSVVYEQAQENNLIQFREESNGLVLIPIFLGKEVVIDDAMPTDGTNFETWIFGQGAMHKGVGSPETPTEVARRPDSGNGGGSTVLYRRWTHAMHPRGYTFNQPYMVGGPDDTDTAGNLANLDTWMRAVPERKMIKVCRVITDES